MCSKVQFTCSLSLLSFTMFLPWTLFVLIKYKKQRKIHKIVKEQENLKKNENIEGFHL